MKNLKYVVFFSLLWANTNLFATAAEENNPNRIVAELVKEINEVAHRYELLIDDKYYELQKVNCALEVAHL